MKPLSRFLAILLSAIFAFVAVGLLGTYVYNLASEDKDVTAVKPESQSSIRTAFQDYNVYIEDAVRYILANAHPEYAYFDVENAELSSKTENKIDDIAGKIDDISQPRYKLALTQLSTTGSKYEKKYSTRLLQIYNELELDITSVQQDEQYDFVYHFKEGNSRVHFTTGLSVLLYCTPDVWDLKRYTEYIETGVFENAPMEELSVDDKWFFSFWQEVLEGDFNSQDEQYLKKKYPSGIPIDTIELVGEYIDDEDKIEIIPIEDVIIGMVEYHCSDDEIPTPKYVGEFYAKAYKLDYYKHLRLKELCNAYQLCHSLIQKGEFDAFMNNLKEPDYPLISIDAIKTAKTQQEIDICRVLNAWLHIAFSNGGLDPTTEVFGAYFNLDGGMR